MNKHDARIATISLGAAVALVALLVLVIERTIATNQHRLETVNVDEAREFARECQRVSGSYRMIPARDNEYDNQRPAGYVIICAENQ